MSSIRTMKTFLALDIAAHVSLGLEWHGRPVRPGRVVYVYAEGRTGLGPRLRAWKAYTGAQRLGILFMPGIMTVNESRDVAAILAAIRDRIGDEPVALLVMLPDINQILIRCNGRLFPTGIFKLLFGRNSITSIRVITMGILSEYRKRGIDMLFHARTFRACMKKGYTHGEFSWILENNPPMNNILIKLGASRYKEYRLFQKTL